MIGTWWLECEASRTAWAADSDGDTCDEASGGVGGTDGISGRLVVVGWGYRGIRGGVVRDEVEFNLERGQVIDFERAVEP
jgi:hypothetical protein